MGLPHTFLLLCNKFEIELKKKEGRFFFLFEEEDENLE